MATGFLILFWEHGGSNFACSSVKSHLNPVFDILFDISAFEGTSKINFEAAIIKKLTKTVIANLIFLLVIYDNRMISKMTYNDMRSSTELLR